MTFIDDDSARVGAELTLSLQTLLGAVKRAKKTLKFLGMGCEDSGSAKGVLPKELEAVLHLREHVEGVGIEDQGFELRGFEKAAKRLLAVGSQSGANGHGIVALEVGGGEEAGEMGVVVIDAGIDRDKEGKLCGDVDFEEIVRALNDIGYDGPLSVEWEDQRMDRWFGAKESYEYVKKVAFPKNEDVVFDAQFAK